MRTLATETKQAEERTAFFEEEIRQTNESAEASEEMIREGVKQFQHGLRAFLKYPVMSSGFV